ncbi:hypothetical protein [Curtobacterium sp. Leaf261]|uniref:hypothetical protein n=1 Tax=Curtobacterium sp. Leaf261 TaxID=1736311 RepID=UPI000701474D|nr:hypothetical protein [Curtobacterium sp. Leaf261]KQO63753.1 hypothetical protein ASF23_05930 [Curtobacterium sp. Leaf261]
MLLLDVDWHPFWSYEWWRDIGGSLVGGIGGVIVGGAAVWVATRANSLSGEATKLAQQAAANEQQRADREFTTDAKRERAEFGHDVRVWIEEMYALGVQSPTASINGARTTREELEDVSHSHLQLGGFQLVVDVGERFDRAREQADHTNRGPVMERARRESGWLVRAFVRGDHLPAVGPTPLPHRSPTGR